MLAIIEYVWKIRGQLKKDAVNYERIFKLLGDTENRMWNKIRRMQLQVERCEYARREMCKMCRVLLEEEGEMNAGIPPGAWGDKFKTA